MSGMMSVKPPAGAGHVTARVPGQSGADNASNVAVAMEDDKHKTAAAYSSAAHAGLFHWLSSLTSETAPNYVKAGAVVALGVASMAIMLVVKTVLVEFKFSCFLFVACMQYLGTTTVLLVQRNVTKSIPAFPLQGFFKNLVVIMFPAQFFFVGNTLTGLGASRDLSMPMFVLLRSFSIPMTLGMEWYLLGRVPPKLCSVGVGVMVLGAFIGAGFDLRVKLSGFFFVQVNNVLTALQGAYLRKKIQDVSGILTSDGILFYNNVFAFLVSTLVLLTVRTDELNLLRNFPDWTSPMFIVLLLCSSFMGFAVSYSAFFCTKVNSALTTAMVGALKNVIVSFIGMFFSDYQFSYASFAGINTGVVGTLVYTAGEVKKAKGANAPVPAPVQRADSKEELV